MFSTALIRHILRDEAVTRGLGDVEARMIVEWLVARAEQIGGNAPSEAVAWAMMRTALRRARAIAHFVRLWTDPNSRGAATQLAGAERFQWPLPSYDIEPGQLMLAILTWTDQQDEIVASSNARRAA